MSSVPELVSPRVLAQRAGLPACARHWVGSDGGMDAEDDRFGAWLLPHFLRRYDYRGGSMPALVPCPKGQPVIEDLDPLSFPASGRSGLRPRRGLLR
jgi:hypothetical protein